MKTKKVPVWHVEWSSGEFPKVSVCLSYEMAKQAVKGAAKSSGPFNITGPHYHVVKDES
jgi:hypothetical protein